MSKSCPLSRREKRAPGQLWSQPILALVVILKEYLLRPNLESFVPAMYAFFFFLKKKKNKIAVKFVYLYAVPVPVCCHIPRFTIHEHGNALGARTKLQSDQSCNLSFLIPQYLAGFWCEYYSQRKEGTPTWSAKRTVTWWELELGKQDCEWIKADEIFFFFALGWKKTLLDSFSHPQNIIFP